MRKHHRYTVFLAGAAVTALVVVPAAIGGGHQDLLRSGVAGSTPLPPNGDGVMLFGINPGGKPWVANRHSSIRVKRNGEVRIKVFGLVIPGNTPPNPLPSLVASLVCNGMVVAATDPVPFSPDGNASFRDKFKVPKPCLAPAILLRPNAAAAAPYIGASG
jgi:hypothetical protein